MKKLFLTSFVFTTGGNEYKEQRLVVAKDKDEAYEKALAWFPKNFPESKMVSCITHEAIDEIEKPKKDVERRQFHLDVGFYQKRYLLLDFWLYLKTSNFDDSYGDQLSVVDNYLKNRAI